MRINVQLKPCDWEYICAPAGKQEGRHHTCDRSLPHPLRLRSAAFIIPLFVAVVFGFASVESSWASCNTSTLVTTPDYASVNTCVGAAARNATVTVSAGSVTWASTLNITKGLTLTGAGVGNTIITSNTTMISSAPDATAIANGEKIKITGFTFDGNATASIFLDLNGASGITDTQPYRSYIIGNNKFQNGIPGTSNGIITAANANANGQLRGVIYNNTFDRCDIILRVFSNNDTREWANTAFNQLAYGTSENLYFEDNTIMYSSSYSGGNPGWIETGQGGRLVARYNSWDLANTSPAEVWDIHGFQNWNGTVNSGQTGTMITERYGNTLTNMSTYRWIDHRGSWGLFFDNILTGSGGNSIDLYGMSTPGSCPSDINPTPTNYNPVVNNTYFFNNTKNGTNVLASMNSTGNPIHCSVTENSNWWNYNASCTASSCTAGIGSGTSAPTGSCTNGTGYWVASTTTPTASASIIQNGKFYQCIGSAWQPYYTPYTYPHPLRGGSSASSPPAAPTNLTGVVQ